MPLASADYPEWLALGCAADWIEREYDVGMRLWRDRPDIIVMGHWYFCPEGAYPVPYLHPWLASENQYGGTYLPTELGEVPSTIRYIKRPLNPRLTGLTVLGDANVWLNSSLYSGRPYWRVDQDGIPLALGPGPLLSNPFRFGGKGEVGSGRPGSILWLGAGKVVSLSSNPFRFGGAGQVVNEGAGAFRFGGAGEDVEEGSGVFRFGGAGEVVIEGDGAFAFGGAGEDVEEGSGIFKFGGAGEVVSLGSGAFRFGGAGEDVEIGSGIFKFGGAGQVVAGDNTSSAGVFFFGGAGTNVRFTVSSGSGKYDFDRSEVASIAGGGVNCVGIGNSGGTASVVNNIAGMYFAAALKTGAGSSTGSAAVIMNVNTTTALFSLQQNTSIQVDFRIMIPTLSTSLQRFKVQVGFMDVTTGSPAEGCWLEYTDNVNAGQWVLHTQKTSGGAGNTSSNSTVAPVAGAINILSVKVTGTSVQFLIDGVSLGTIATNVPTGATGIAATIIKSVGTTSVELDVDYIAPTVTF